MKIVFNIILSALATIYLIPFSFYLMYKIHETSKRMDIPLAYFLADHNWITNFRKQHLKKGYEISTGVWILIYIAYLLFK
jgi:hypothetical protein